MLNSFVEQYQKIHNECKSSTNTDEKEIAKIFQGQPIEVEALGAHLLCVNKKFNIQNDNGDIDQENFRKVYVALNKSLDKTDIVIANCSVKKEGATPEEAAVELIKCTRKYAPLEPPKANAL